MEKQSIEELIKKWDTSRDGLTKEEAKKRLQRDGRNELKAVKPPTLWQRVFEILKG